MKRISQPNLSPIFLERVTLETVEFTFYFNSMCDLRDYNSTKDSKAECCQCFQIIHSFKGLNIKFIDVAFHHKANIKLCQQT